MYPSHSWRGLSKPIRASGQRNGQRSGPRSRSNPLLERTRSPPGGYQSHVTYLSQSKLGEDRGRGTGSPPRSTPWDPLVDALDPISKSEIFQMYHKSLTYCSFTRSIDKFWPPPHPPPADSPLRPAPELSRYSAKIPYDKWSKRL